MTPRYSSPYLSADGRATYVTDQNGTRHRVVVLDGQTYLNRRVSKAAKRAAKRVMVRSRRERERESA